MCNTDEVIPIDEFCQRTGKNRRQVWGLYNIHAGLKHQVLGEKSSRVNWTLWQKIIVNPMGYVKLVKKKTSKTK